MILMKKEKMKKEILLCLLLGMLLSACGGKAEKRVTDEQAVTAVKNYCLAVNPDLESVADAGEYPVYWDISSSDEHEIVVLFRSYTGVQVWYHVDPATGETYATQFVPGITAEEERTDESLNVWDYLD